MPAPYDNRMLRILRTTTDPPEAIRAALTQSSFLDRADAEVGVRSILEAVRERGDASVREVVERYDGVRLEQFEVTAAEIAAARSAVDAEFLAALEVAAENIRAFHEPQRRESWRMERNGATLGQIVRPLASVGILVPSASAPLPSTALMTTIPARVAGVEQVAVFTAPRRDGTANPHTLVAAQVGGAHRIFKVGGPAAVAAMAYGTESIPRVDKIVGPGNLYTVLAKRLVFGIVDIEMLPGPSEVLVLADHTARADRVAADLISQAEHGPDSLVVLVTPSEALAAAVAAEIERQVPLLPRAELAQKSLREHGAAVVTRDLEEAIELANLCAAEHVEVMVADPEAGLARLRNAGTVLVGAWGSVPLADYVAGPSHVLPTGGTARFASPLNVDDFVKKTNLLIPSEAAFRRLAPPAITLARTEGLEAHARALSSRLEDGDA
jgi:histidinol dehydrogenase